jgi:LysR family transcriptional regulator, low CO2-responsive transcriptional regulator
VVAGFGVAFLSAHTISLDLKAGNLVVLDVQGFPAMLNWYLVHNRTKRLPPVAAAFRDFLLRDGASLIERLVHFELGVAPETATTAPPAAAAGAPAPARRAPRRALRSTPR